MGRERGEASLPHRILNKRITRASLPSELLNVIEEGHERCAGAVSSLRHAETLVS